MGQASEEERRAEVWKRGQMGEWWAGPGSAGPGSDRKNRDHSSEERNRT